MTGFLAAALSLALGGLAAAPALAQPAPANRAVFVCDYNDLKENDRSVVMLTAPFVVSGEFNPERITDEWFAWYRANGAPSDASRYWAHCRWAPETSPASVQDLTAGFATWIQRKASWMPAYGAAYAPPRDLYYYCSGPEQGLKREFVTDLFKTPLPARINGHLGEAQAAHRAWMRSQGMKYYYDHDRCHATTPEAYQVYTAMLDGWAAGHSDPSRPYALTRSAWPGMDPPAAPNLIDDLAARAKYAAMRIAAPTTTSAKAAPPPPGPKPKPGAQTASLTVKTDTSAKDAAKAWDEQVKKTLAAEVQKKVETAAKQAQADAKYKAQVEAFFAERRKQGRAQ